MKLVRQLSFGCVLAVALACAAVAAPQSQPETAALPQNSLLWHAAPHASGSAPVQLAHQYVAAEKPEDKKDLRKKLSDELSKEFDAHIKRQQKELEDLEKQIANLRKVLAKRLEAKGTIVERRAEQLIQDAEGLGWNAPSSPRGAYGQPQLGGSAIFPSSASPKLPRQNLPEY
jgi:methionine-rich copper-binding protein CopC